MPEIELTMSDRGRTVPVRVGDHVILSLPENATTGVRWNVPASDALQIVADANVPGGGGIGAEGVRILTLKPVRPGTIELELLRHRAWENEATADASFSVKFEVA